MPYDAARPPTLDESDYAYLHNVLSEADREYGGKFRELIAHEIKTYRCRISHDANRYESFLGFIEYLEHEAWKAAEENRRDARDEAAHESQLRSDYAASRGVR